MNERIKELAFEANKDLDGNVPIGFAEKFAELIVKECADLIDSKRELGLDPNGEYLKQHFGVEE